ncbi:MAG TPA: DUF2934 domain-containing protein [Verrucomicrobiae bacterium]
MSNYENISKRAYELWEQAGKPEGQQTEHWLQAEHESQQQEESRGGQRRSSQTANAQASNERGSRSDRQLSERRT